MTYVTEQTSKELRAHVQRLKRMPGWHDPLVDRLWIEIQELDKRIVTQSEHIPVAAPHSGQPRPRQRKHLNEYHRGLMEAFHLVNMIGNNPQGRTGEETIRFMVRSLADLTNVSESDIADQAAPAQSKELAEALAEIEALKHDLARHIEIASELATAQPHCAAQHASVGAYEPQDCDWPVCGCDPHADKVIAALQESGLLKDPQVAPNVLSDAICAVLAERARQISEEGWTLEHDDDHASGEMAKAAAAYALNAGNVATGWPKNPLRAFCEPPQFWPWSREWWKPDTQRWMLVKAGALIVAEIERIDRLAAAQQAKEGA